MWFKSSYGSGSGGDSRVEVAPTPGTIHIRGSKRTDGPLLAVTPSAWTDFVSYAFAR
ncbi:DUF397 domain-containing protein [Streptomyces sp. TG1A-8]|uniref:DUF397 domain-containing protein n=1 Tax=Streptomyces sp. TG1A-8 TaxID=3051385 RepID=UPI00265C3151|nr:DUF397 domain-containing protein [Streptomyces sp. TG1A-8]MDO0927176.1 DUF397 domain-containing protein [Streptomyces sp. TG1A-8]